MNIENEVFINMSLLAQDMYKMLIAYIAEHKPDCDFIAHHDVCRLCLIKLVSHKKNSQAAFKQKVEYALEQLVKYKYLIKFEYGYIVIVNQLLHSHLLLQEQLKCSDKKQKKQALTYEQMQKHCSPPMPAVLKIHNARRTHLNAISADLLPTLEDWGRYFEKISQSDFLMGRIKDKTGRSFHCTFDWLIKRSNVIKVLEQTYRNK